MSLEYAPRGLVGMLTPQANTTVEPEFNLLWPRGRRDDQRAADERQGVDVGAAGRLFRQLRRVAAAVRQCAGGCRRRRPAPARPISPGREREAAVVADIAARSGHPFVTAALAVVDALTVTEGEADGSRVALSRRSQPRQRGLLAKPRLRGRGGRQRVQRAKARFIRSTVSAARRRRRRCARLRTSRSTPSSCSAPGCRRCGRSPTRSAGRARR